MVKPVEITRVKASERAHHVDLVALEEPLEIRIGFGPLQQRQQHSLSVTMRTPGHDFELALGFLFTEGVIQAYDQVESVKHCEDVGRQEERGNVVRVELKPDVSVDLSRLQRNFYTTSSCGVCGKSSLDAVSQQCGVITSDVKIETSTVHALTEQLRKSQVVFEHTGGLHAVGLFEAAGKLLALREDVGRHNALDKLIGAQLVLQTLPLHRHVLLVSGRASFELVQKAVMAGIPVMAAVGAPSSLAVDLARKFNQTLLGFVRDNRFNCYSGNHRITS